MTEASNYFLLFGQFFTNNEHMFHHAVLLTDI